MQRTRMSVGCPTRPVTPTISCPPLADHRTFPERPSRRPQSAQESERDAVQVRREVAHRGRDFALTSLASSGMLPAYDLAALRVDDVALKASAVPRSGQAPNGPSRHTTNEEGVPGVARRALAVAQHFGGVAALASADRGFGIPL